MYGSETISPSKCSVNPFGSVGAIINNADTNCELTSADKVISSFNSATGGPIFIGG